jgi:hypothetical protein
MKLATALLLALMLGCQKPQPPLMVGVVYMVRGDQMGAIVLLVEHGKKHGALFECNFDNLPMKDDLVEVSATSAGKCHDTGISYKR